MAYSRRLGVVSILSACFLVAAGCADDEDRKGSNAEDGGEGGESGGKAGTSAGGASNNAGNGGAPGSAGSGMAGDATSGSGGEAGSGSGGEAGSGSGGEAGSGSGGEAGGPGIVGGAAGETSGGAAGEGGASGGGGVTAGGAGGESGAGGAAGPVAASCVYTCDDDTDCTFTDGPPQDCNDVTKVCEDPAQVCETHDDCTPFLSLWYPGCTSNADCQDFEACIDYQGTAYCAIVDDPTFGCDPLVSVTLPLHVGGGDVDVCREPDARCASGACILGCGSDFVGCPEGGGDQCNEATGLCECEMGDECDTGVCADQHCTQCQNDDDCLATTASTGLDTCVAGKCGCSSADSCLDPNFLGAVTTCR